MDHPQKAPREIARLCTDNYRKCISESSVYRILKVQGLKQAPAFELVKTTNEFKDKTVRANQIWQTDFIYSKISGLVLAVILIGDYSRFNIHWKLCSIMTAAGAAQTIVESMVKSNLPKNQKPKLLSDNGN